MAAKPLVDLVRNAPSPTHEVGVQNLDYAYHAPSLTGGGPLDERTPLMPPGRSGSDMEGLIVSGSEEGMTDAGLPLIREDSTDEAPQGQSIRTLGTFAGVYCPVSLSMFSTILFLRIGFLLGHAGLILTLVQFGLAYAIIFMTILSICAISTNGAVEGGGAYFMISRALGPEFGGSIGLLFFLAQTCSCAMSVTGFVEALVDNFGEGGSLVGLNDGMPAGTQWWNYMYCSLVLAFCLILSLIGGKVFGKTNIFTLLVTFGCGLTVFISMLVKGPLCVEYPASNQIYTPLNLSGTPYTDLNCTNSSALYTGFSRDTFSANLHSNYTVDYLTGKTMNFAHLFAVLFSSITGLMNGANMSGDLKEPSKAIPKGTLSATLVSFVTYLLLSIMCSGTADRRLLIGNYNYIESVNVWAPFVVTGIFATMLSAALGNLIGGSRILHALAKDEIFWFFLKPATITTKHGNPIVAVVMAWFLVQLVLLIGSLNAIAPMCSELFLLGYASTNLACLALDLSSAPNFRPMFKYFSAYTAAIGMLGSIAMCFLVDPIYASIAISVLIALVLLLHLRGFQTSWGSISQALLFHQVRKYLLLLDPRKDSVKYWRPQMLLLVSNARGSCQLIDFVNDLKKSGLYVVGHVRSGDLDETVEDPLGAELPRWLALIDELKVKAFVELTMSGSGVRAGAQHLMRLAGVGGMKPNTVCLGFRERRPAATDDSFERLQSARKLARRRRIFGRWRAGKDLAAAESDAVDGESASPPSSTDRFPAPASAVRLSTDAEYVLMIADALKLNKNVCVHRHFHLLDKAAISTKQKMSVDVWPVDFLRPDAAAAGRFDNTCLFMLQIACVLHMSAEWKGRTVLRVFRCTQERTDGVVPAVAHAPPARKDAKMSNFLRDLRIRCQIKTVAWDTTAVARRRPLGNSAMQGNSTAQGNSGTGFPDAPTPSREGSTDDLTRPELPDHYLRSVGDMIRAQSANTAVVFLYLPSPPVMSAAQVAEGATADMDDYLHRLELMTADLPPTVMVRGVQPVTSTSL